MTALARRVYLLRRRATDFVGLIVALMIWPLLAVGTLGPSAFARNDLLTPSVLVIFVVIFGHVVRRELFVSSTASASPWLATARELELAILLLTGVYALVALTGGPASFLYPLVYALVSFLAILHRARIVACACVIAVVALELCIGIGSRAGFRVDLFAHHLTFIGFFAIGNLLVLASFVRRLRNDHRHRIADELDRMRQEARDFRLIASQLPLESRPRSRDEEESRMAQGAVESIHEHVFHHLDVMRTGLGLHTCALLWCEAPDEHDRSGRKMPRLSIKELATASELVREQRVLETPGLLAAILRDPKPLRLKALAGKRLPPYYQGPEPVTDLCAIPLHEGTTLRGILCGDRIGDRPFDVADERMLAKAAEQIMRVIAHERVFTAIERGKYEQEQFYRASELLNQSLTLEDVYDKTFTAMRAIACYDLAVITDYDHHAGRHRVLAVDVSDSDDHIGIAWREIGRKLQNRVFDNGPGMIAMAVKNRHYMPASGELHDPETVVFDETLRLRRGKSLLVLPLIRGDQVLGTITLVASKPLQYPQQTREMLRVIGHQVCVSLQNARMYQAMEERATTDGLTGLTNHRAFQERLAQLQALAERTHTQFALILTDIDHFKGINDTYGHPVGDQVLKRVAALFAGRARKVDIVARYGGEEFVLVLPDTDGEGAEHFANKLREEVGSQIMTSEHGSFQVTISMGIAEYPADGSNRQELIERADQALYYCKEHGRNCVARWSKIA